MRYRHEIEEDIADAEFYLEGLEDALKNNKRAATRLPRLIDQQISRIEELKEELHGLN